jgi:hypothetical protein
VSAFCVATPGVVPGVNATGATCENGTTVIYCAAGP